MGSNRLDLRIALAALSVVIATIPEASDGVVEINQQAAIVGGVTATDAPGWPVTIDAPGSYRLSGSLTLTSSEAEISPASEITSNSVSLDLNGFEIRCLGSSFWQGAIVAPLPVSSVEVLNGSIISEIPEGSSGHASIDMLGEENRIDGVQIVGDGVGLGNSCRLTNSSSAGANEGIGVGNDCYVRNVGSGGTNGVGLFGGSNVTVIDSEFIGNQGQSGLMLGDRAKVLNVIANNNSDTGITVGANSSVKNSRTSSNPTCGIESGGGTVEGNLSSDNSGCGILTTGPATVKSNTVTSNGSLGDPEPGILLLAGGIATRNTVSQNAVGITVAGDGAAHSNTAFSNETGIYIQSGTAIDNAAVGNSGLGIDAVGAIDGGGNRAGGNGDPWQCVGVACDEIANRVVTRVEVYNTDLPPSEAFVGILRHGDALSREDVGSCPALHTVTTGPANNSEFESLEGVFSYPGGTEVWNETNQPLAGGPRMVRCGQRNSEMLVPEPADRR